jgi:hypothetical protein
MRLREVAQTYANLARQIEALADGAPAENDRD